MHQVKNKIYGSNYEALNKELEPFRNQGKKIVMCSGTFDLFHIGHMRLLATAKTYGDVLIVAVKSDKAASLKKEDPPVICQDDRMEAIAHCVSSDYVVLAEYDVMKALPREFKYDNTSSFEWLTIFTPVIRTIRPNIFVHEDNPQISEARQQLFELCGIEGIKNPRTPGISSTEIIECLKLRLLRKM